MIPEHQSSLSLVKIELIVDHWLGYSRKKKQQGGWGHTFLKNPWICFSLDPLKIPTRPNHQDPSGNSTLFILGHPCKFLLLFLWYLKEFHIVCLSPHPVWFSAGTAHLKTACWLPSPYLATYLLASCVVFYVLGSHQLSGGILVWWPIQCISRKISLNFSFWFLMRVSRTLYLFWWYISVPPFQFRLSVVLYKEQP